MRLAAIHEMWLNRGDLGLNLVLDSMRLRAWKFAMAALSAATLMWCVGGTWVCAHFIHEAMTLRAYDARVVAVETATAANSGRDTFLLRIGDGGGAYGAKMSRWALGTGLTEAQENGQTAVRVYCDRGRTATCYVDGAMPARVAACFGVGVALAVLNWWGFRRKYRRRIREFGAAPA